MAKLIQVAFVFVFGIALFSCSEESLYHRTHIIKDGIWTQKMKPFFKVDISDTTKMYDMVLTIRTTTEYPYSNMWLYFTVYYPTKKSQKFPIQLVTCDREGRWLGKKSGSLVSFSKLLIHNKLALKGTYKFTVEQGITQKNLSEVVDVSLDVFAYKEM